MEAMYTLTYMLPIDFNLAPMKYEEREKYNIVVSTATTDEMEATY